MKLIPLSTAETKKGRLSSSKGRIDIRLDFNSKQVEVSRGRHLGGVSAMAFGVGSKKLDTQGALAVIHKMVKRARDEGFDRFVLEFADFKELLGRDDYQAGHLLAEHLIAADYQFNRYKTAPEGGFPAIGDVCVQNVSSQGKKGIEEGSIVGNWTSRARDLCNTSAKDMTPTDFADAIKIFGKRAKVEVSSMSGAGLRANHFGLLLAVGGAAANEPYVVILEYNGGKDGEKPIVLLGKGITYDTGGLSLKPSDSMIGMQRDMTGAATVMMAVFAAAELGVKKNVVAIGMMAENAIGPNAYRPGDVLTSKAGITVENGNSDAEGRLVLADGITYVGEEYPPKVLIDVATLTGAALIAMGDHHSAILTTDRKLEDHFRVMGETAANLVYPLPLVPSIHEAYLESKIADIASTRLNGSKHGGSISAAAFLNKFVEAAGIKRHVHIDIAPRMDVPAGTDLAGPSLGEPVPLLVQAIREL